MVRTYIGALIDRLATRWLGFPPEICSYTIIPVLISVSIESSQFELAADLYQPILAPDEAPSGTILIRCPYGRGLALALLSARPYAARGYQCLFVSCRGTFGSGGSFDPWRNEEEDGQAIVAWMRQQSWYTGSFATLGGSYLGFVQWALLRNPPEDMAAAVIQCAPHDFAKQLWGTGSLALEWGEAGWGATWKALNTQKSMRPVLNGRPLGASVKKHFGGRAPWLDYVIDHPDISDISYEGMRCGEALERANIPILLAGGWFDVFAEQTLEQYARLSERSMHVALLMGPWNHMRVGLDAKLYQRSFAWLEEHLGKRKKEGDKSILPVQYFVTGAQEWREVQKWPPTTHVKELYLRSGNVLTTEKPSVEDHSLSTFTFNLDHPTLTTGGNLLSGGGSADDTSLSTRPDVLTFTTSPLSTDLEIAGKVTISLNHRSSIPYVDLFVRISEVDIKGRSHSITDTYKRLDPSREQSELLNLELRDCAHRFAKRHRIRLIVAGASHPQYAINNGTGSDTGWKSTIHTIRHGERESSRVLLPVVA